MSEPALSFIGLVGDLRTAACLHVKWRWYLFTQRLVTVVTRQTLSIFPSFGSLYSWGPQNEEGKTTKNVKLVNY